MNDTKKKGKQLKRPLVTDTAEHLRELILDKPPGSYIGSLNDVAKQLGVGIVTVQQTARILEHEGLLTVKRGPGGGYYGTRPNDAALERALATYMRIHDISYRDAFELSILLDCEIIKSAAQHCDAAHIAHIKKLQKQLELIVSAEDMIDFEQNFRETLLTIVSKPMLELLSKVAMQLYGAKGDPEVFTQYFGIKAWKQGRERIVQAILIQDPELAFFEAQRFQTLTIQWMNSDS